MRGWTRAGALGIAAAAMLLAAAAAFLFFVDPAKAGFLPRCIFLQATGCYCPGCGSMRALHQLLHGNVSAAFSLNPLMMLSLPLIGAMLMKPQWIYRRWVPWTVLAVLVAYGIMRNIPSWPFSLLAPH